MAFESLTGKFQNIFKNLRGKGKLTEDDIKVAMREVKLALLEADVNYKVVKEFVNHIKERANGEDVLKSLTPGQQVIKIVNDELIMLMSADDSSINISDKGKTVIMMTGLQGAGKTTAAGKLAYNYKKKGKKVLLVACDIYRPAAIKQLQVVGEKVDVPVFQMGVNNPVDISKAAMKHADLNGYDMVIVDTAGRLHIDENMMKELEDVKKIINPNEILLVIDSMTGQDAVNVAEKFNELIGVDGIILTKLDGDTRGGAALSVTKVTGKPIKYVGMGEKHTDLQEFHPERMASRILGMGDVLSLIEKAEEVIDKEKAKELEEKIRKQDFDLEDFLEQMQQMKKLGPIGQVMNMIPGLGNKISGMDIDEEQITGQLKQTEAIIKSMTVKERRNPSILNGSRKNRVAKGSGTNVAEVNKLIKQFTQMKDMMKMFTKGKKGMFKMPFGKMPF